MRIVLYTIHSPIIFYTIYYIYYIVNNILYYTILYLQTILLYTIYSTLYYVLTTLYTLLTYYTTVYYLFYTIHYRRPMQSIVSGKIARLVLIQLQFVKKELLVAMQAIDDLFNANQVHRPVLY